jgi:ElaB/YqjD/DUF883 family membrane-anchored ribosome-binding protein
MTNQTQPHAQHRDSPVSAIRDQLSELKDTVRSGVQDAADSGRKVIQTVRAAAADTASDLGDSAVRARNTLGQKISDRPFTSIAIAAGVGAALGAVWMWRRR